MDCYKRSRKTVAVLLLALTLCLEPAACKTAQKEVISDEALTVLIGSTDNYRNYLAAIQDKFPDVKLDIEYYAGPNTTEYIQTKLQHDDVPDLVFAPNIWAAEQQKAYLLDLSGYDFVDRYALSFQNEREIDGKLYLLPSSYTIGSLYYNKTLFAEKGWQVPHSYEELLTLTKQIREESDLTPVCFSGAYPASYFRIMTTFSQCGFLTTPAGKKWTEEFAKGNASSEEGFGEGLAQIQGLIDAGAFDETDAESRDSDVYERLLKRQAAIGIPQSKQSVFAEMMEESTDEFGAIPYYGQRDGEVILSTAVGFSFGLGRQLGEPGNQKKLEQALEIMDYLSSKEGQMAMMSGAADVLPLVSGKLPDSFPPYQDIEEYVESGRIAPYFYTGYEDIVMQAGDAIKAAMFSGQPLKNTISAMDKAKRAALSGSSDSYLAQADADFSHEQTVQYIADVLLEQGKGDLSMVTTGGCINGIYNNNGVNGRLFSGKIRSSNYNTILPGLNTLLVNVTMTGRQITELLEQGRILSDENTGEQAAFAYYWSGLEVTLQDGKVTAASLSDGSRLNDDTEYKVSMAAGDYDEERFIKAAETGNSVADAYMEYLDKHKNIQIPEICRK